MKTNSISFINELQTKAQEIISAATSLQELPPKTLTKRIHAKSWNVLECVEHMNLYHYYYLKEIRKQINKAKHPASTEFKPGWMGNYSALNMLPKKQGKINLPMKTFKDMDPIGKPTAPEVITTFLQQMKELHELLEKSKQVDLRKTKCHLTIKWLKFTLGDTFHFIINHNKRHFIQIQKILD